MKSGYKYQVTTAALHITYFCTHRCSMCYAHGEGQYVKHPPLQKLKLIIDELSVANVQEVSLVGGDPASYPQIGDLVKYISEKGMRTSILSNTLEFSNITPSGIAKYISAFEGTVHGDTADAHDVFCGCSGAFIKLTDNLKKYHQLGAKIGIALNIAPSSVEALYNIVENLIVNHEVPLDYIVIQRIVPFGRAQSSSEFVLLKEQVKIAFDNIELIDKKFEIDIIMEDPFPLCVLDEKHWKYMSRCEWGWSKVALNPRGDLSRCGADPRFLLGNIFESPLLKIWNESEILISFRSRAYLPGRCQICDLINQCGGGCPLSCEKDKDHSTDYLLNTYLSLSEEIKGDIMFTTARKSDLSDMLKIEWANFSKYLHIFNVKSISKWFEHNSDMFYVVVDQNGQVFGYSVLVPMSIELYSQVRQGKYSSLVDFPESGVLRHMESPYYHLEVIAVVPAKNYMPVSGVLIKGVGKILSKYAKYVTASPMTEAGIALSNFFGFAKVAEENFNGEIYTVAELEISDIVQKKLSTF